MKLTKEYYKKLSEDYEKLLLKSMKLTRDVLSDSKRHLGISLIFHIMFFLLGFLWGII